MTGREAIEWHLDNFGYFSPDLVVKATGVSSSQVRSASYKMHKNGEIKLIGRNWRTNIYVEVDDEEGPKDSGGFNTIFQECKSSPAMKRVLSVYGHRPLARSENA